MRNLTLALGMSVLALSWALPASAAGAEFDIPADYCAPTVDQTLADLKVNRADLDRIAFTTRKIRDGDRDQFRLRRIDAWVRYKTLKGSLIIEMTLDCMVRQIYTRGGLKLPNVKSF